MVAAGPVDRRCANFTTRRNARGDCSLWIVAQQISEWIIGSGTLFEKVERLVNTTRYRKADVLLCLFGI